MSYQTTNYAPSLKVKAAALLEYRRRQGTAVSPPTDWRERLPAMFPDHLRYEMSEPHLELGAWADGITNESSARPFIAIWPRGRGKSTWAEMITADMGARGVRKYVLYVSETQDQADKHVETIQAMLESDEVTRFYPQVGQPHTGKHGSRTWRRSLLKAANGFSVEAIGLDKAVRGQKIDWARPDLIVFDDIDAKHDTEHATEKKQGTITTSILPSGAVNVAVLFCQNLIHEDSIAHRLSKRPGEEGAADYLTDRIISGPYPAVDGLKYELQPSGDLYRWVITAGESLWRGFTLNVCEAEINRDGPTSYELESQHAVDADNPHALLTTEIIDKTRVVEYGDLVRIVIGLDPSGGAGRCGIVGVGKAKRFNEWHGYVIANDSTKEGASSLEWAERALLMLINIKADAIVVERNFGGDMAKNNIQQTKIIETLDGRIRAAQPDDIVFDRPEAAENYDGDLTPVVLILNGAKVRIIEVTASRGKEVRAEPVATAYQQGRMHHVGHYKNLQKQWTQWIPGTKPSPDELDAEVWAATELGLSYDHVKLSDSQPEQKSKWTGYTPDATNEGSRWRM